MIEEEGHSDPIEKLKQKYMETINSIQESLMNSYDKEKTRIELKLDREIFQTPEDDDQNKL